MTAEQRLAELGVTIEAAKSYVLAHLDQLGTILQVSRQFGITNAMLGEIVAWPNAAVSAQDVKAYCTSQGFDSSVLDLPAGQVRLISMSDATVTEGGTLVHNIVLSQTTTSPIGMDAVIAGGSLSTADYGTITATNGVTIVNGAMSIPAGVSSFQIMVPTIDDALPEPTETSTFYIGSFAAHITVNDNDSGSSSGLVSVVGDPTADEGVALHFLVALTAAATATIQLPVSLELVTATAADLGVPSFTDGVSYANGQLVVPAGVQYFSVTFPTVNDTIHEGFETLRLTVDGVTGTGYIADNDPAPMKSVELIGLVALDVA